MRRLLAVVLFVTALALAVSSCGGGGSGDDVTAHVVPRARLDVYSSLPLTGVDGPSGRAAADGVELAFTEAKFRVHGYRIDYRSLNDSGDQGPWSSSRTLTNASTAARDPMTSYYIGELNPQASSLSARITAAAGFAQVSPPAGPSHHRASTFLSLTPGAAVQAAAMVQAFRRVGCTRVALGELNQSGANLQHRISADARQAGIRIVDNSVVDGSTSSIVGYAIDLRDLGANCFVYDGRSIKTAVALATRISALTPHTALFGTSSVCNTTWTSVAANAYCTSPLLPISKYPGGAAFTRAYRRVYGAKPDSTYALYGYEAAELFMAHVRKLGARAENRRKFAASLATADRAHSVIGPYSFDSTGDTTARDYGLYTGNRDGVLVFYKRLVTS